MIQFKNSMLDRKYVFLSLHPDVVVGRRQILFYYYLYSSVVKQGLLHLFYKTVTIRNVCTDVLKQVLTLSELLFPK